MALPIRVRIESRVLAGVLRQLVGEAHSRSLPRSLIRKAAERRWGKRGTEPLSGFFLPYFGLEERGIHLLMDATNKCNLRCVMCHFALDSVWAERAVQWPEERVAKLEREVLPRVLVAYLSAGSEPLMWKGFPKLLAAMQAAAVPSFTMFTNGTLMTEDLAERIVQARMPRVCLSLDGATKEVYESVRIGARFEQLLTAIERLNAAKARANSHLPELMFTFTLMARNVDELPELLHLAQRHGVRYVSIAHMVVIEGLGTERESLIHQKARANRALDSARALAAELGIELAHMAENFPGAEVSQPPVEPQAAPSMSASRAPARGRDRSSAATDASAPATVEVARPKTRFYARSAAESPRSRTYPALETLPARPVCDAPWKQFGIKSDGTVTPCCYWYTNEPLGDFGTQSFDEIWQGEGYRRLRWEILTGNLGPNCARCPINGIGAVDEAASFHALNTRAPQ